MGVSFNACAQDDLSPYWDGVWNAEGTLFTIAVKVEAGVMQVSKIETMGFEWKKRNGSGGATPSRISKRKQSYAHGMKRQPTNGSWQLNV